jgi:hypothetical protein
MESNNNGGMGVSTVLGLIFIVLKLVGVIDWSWIWVLSPFWIGFALILLLAVLFGIIKS